MEWQGFRGSFLSALVSGDTPEMLHETALLPSSRSIESKMPKEEKI